MTLAVNRFRTTATASILLALLVGATVVAASGLALGWAFAALFAVPVATFTAFTARTAGARNVPA